MYRSIDRSIDLSLYRSIDLSIYRSIDLSISLSLSSVYLTMYLSIYLSTHLSVYLSICLSICLSIHLLYLSICKLENQAILRDFLQKWKVESAELTASYQCILRCFQSTCRKHCACHEKVMPGHTKCCTCHATSSQQT